ncbi:glycosyltransferase family 4 protein [Oceanobacillus kimchii]|uniref:Undecaprenyl-phosphate alpha-N-acetylglucosaminyl 1-phosphate transferase n=1 Tax=Oceanobacillus kimchii TaxID=746691 RepID=A0ABQ5TL95_9BACI|nr:MraY family glycosyltransferase [Oceanobacillus kimchii]GLO67596.1 undecaprenyl-phosphate alpha-N-acetylglucosaminyl 1-phosphate transferase [Oceanobacillus kimchii]
MWSIEELLIAFLLSVGTVLIVTPLMIKLFHTLNFVDRPDQVRKMHKIPKPSMGGLGIFIGIAVGFIYLSPDSPEMIGIIIGAVIILLTGLLDDMFNLRASYKLAGQLMAATVVTSSGLVIEKLTIPFAGTVFLNDYIGIALSIFWIVAAANAINLIDGLDGLAAGISVIGLSSILVMAIMDYRILVIGLCVILIGSTLGFLPYNFYPSKIFMGDTGALLLGYSIAVVSMLGLFKNIAFFSFIVPAIVLAIPIFDTILAIFRRLSNHQGIAVADNKHIHYLLMNKGYSHRKSVLIIYGFSIYFGVMAVIFNSARMITSLMIGCLILFAIQLFSEIVGIADKKKPILSQLRILGEKVKINR